MILWGFTRRPQLRNPPCNVSMTVISYSCYGGCHDCSIEVLSDASFFRGRENVFASQMESTPAKRAWNPREYPFLTDLSMRGFVRVHVWRGELLDSILHISCAFFASRAPSLRSLCWSPQLVIQKADASNVLSQSTGTPI